VNICAHILAILKRLMQELVLGLKDVSSIRKLKNEYYALIAENLLLLLVISDYVIQYYNRLRAKTLNQDQKYNIEIN